MTKSKKELRDEIERILDRHSLGMMKNKEWKNMNIDELLSLFNKENKAKEEEVEERIKERIAKLKREHKPLQDEYNLLYQRWFEFGHRDKQLERKLKSYESGAEGNKMCSLQERIAELKRFLYSLKKLKQND